MKNTLCFCLPERTGSYRESGVLLDAHEDGCPKRRRAACCMRWRRNLTLMVKFSVPGGARDKLSQRCESCWTEPDPLAFRLQAAPSLWEMPHVALNMHKGDPPSLGMMSSSIPCQRQCLYLTLFMLCFSQVISSCRHVLCLPLKQPPPWSHSHTRARVTAWDKRALTWVSQTGAQGWQTLSGGYKPRFLLWCKNYSVFPLPKVCSHCL